MSAALRGYIEAELKESAEEGEVTKISSGDLNGMVPEHMGTQEIMKTIADLGYCVEESDANSFFVSKSARVQCLECGAIHDVAGPPFYTECSSCGSKTGCSTRCPECGGHGYGCGTCDGQGTIPRFVN